MDIVFTLKESISESLPPTTPSTASTLNNSLRYVIFIFVDLRAIYKMMWTKSTWYEIALIARKQGS